MTIEQKIADVLAKLSTLSEAPAGNLEAQIARSAPESSAPMGATESELSDRSLRDRSLYDWYRLQFERHAGNSQRLLSLCLLGEREYLERVNRIAHEQTAEKGSIIAYSQDGAAVEAIHALRVIEWYEGVAAIDVAVAEGETEVWVRKIRTQQGRYPGDGRKRPEFLDLDEDERRRKVASLVARGMGAQKIAHRLGVSKHTVQRYWPLTTVPSAADW